MTVLLTLTTAGIDSGPFDLYTNIDGYITPFAINISKSSLLSGYTSTVVPDYANIVRVKSSGLCSNYIDIVLTNTSTTTTTITPPLTFLSLGYSLVNTVRSIADASFSSARNNGDITATTNFSVGCYLDNGFFLYLIHRAFGGFDTSGVTTATSGGIRINIATNNLLAPVNFGIVRTVVSHPFNHPWNISDFTDSNGGVLQTSLVSIGPGATGNINFPFNPTGLSYINSNNDCTFAIIQYTNDGLAVAPLASTPQIISGANVNFKLYYS